MMVGRCPRGGITGPTDWALKAIEHERRRVASERDARHVPEAPARLHGTQAVALPACGSARLVARHGSWGPNGVAGLRALSSVRAPPRGAGIARFISRANVPEGGRCWHLGLNHSENNQPGLAALQREQEDPR